jgi:mono/diheme cytochrome c family protein
MRSIGLHPLAVLVAGLVLGGAVWAAPVADTAVSGTNVPDAITRRTGLRVTPMSWPARVYAENCQGCHGNLGVSVTEIPGLAGRVGYFTRSPAGRRYLIQVPNVALNPNSDADIAELMNWVLRTYSPGQMAAGFQPYTASEVAELRRERVDIIALRRAVVDDLLAHGQLPTRDALAISPSLLY